MVTRLALQFDFTIEPIELNDEEYSKLVAKEWTPLDFNVHHIFLTEEDWDNFKFEVNQY